MALSKGPPHDPTKNGTTHGGGPTRPKMGPHMGGAVAAEFVDFTRGFAAMNRKYGPDQKWGDTWGGLPDQKWGDTWGGR